MSARNDAKFSSPEHSDNVYFLDQIISSIVNCFNHEFYEDALLLSEFLYFHFKCPEVKEIVQKCKFECQRAKSIDENYYIDVDDPMMIAKISINLFRSGNQLKAKQLIFEKSCSKYMEVDSINLQPLSDFFADSLPFILSLLGHIYFYDRSFDKSQAYFYQSLRLNPLLFSSYKKLFRINPNANIETFFTKLKFENSTEYLQTIKYFKTDLPLYCHIKPLKFDLIKNLVTPEESQARTIESPTNSDYNIKNDHLNKKLFCSELNSVSGIFEISNTANSSNNYTKSDNKLLSEIDLSLSPPFSSSYKYPINRKKPLIPRKNTIKNSDFDSTPTFSRKNQSPGSKIFDKTKKIQSLKPPFPYSNSSSIKENSPMISANLDHGSCSSINMMEHKENFIYNTNNEEVTDEKHRLFVYHQSFLSVFIKFIGTRKLFCQYEYDKAIAGILSLPNKLLDVSEIRYNLFIYYFEHHKLDKAISIMNKILEKDSSWLKGIDKFSTALHAKNEYNMLLHLSDKMRTKNYLNKQTWVVTGNLFSLMKMPDEVIKCFKRATKIDMNYSYGFFLLGYEYLMNKDYENAISMYQSCIKIDPMNYKYWNASGQCSREKGNFEDAKYCFSRAIHLNSKSPSLLTNLASIHLDLNEYNTAEILLNKALEIDPINLTAKFILAKTLSYLQKYNESNEILLKLKDHKPEEAILYTLLYINYKEQQKEIDAQQNYNLAKKYGPFLLSKMLYEWSKNSKIAQSKNSVLNKSLNLDCDIQASFLVANSSSYCP